MNTEEQVLSDLMKEATAGLHAPSGSAERLVQRSHRRRRRQRLALSTAFSSAAVVAVVSAVTVPGARHTAPLQAAGKSPATSPSSTASAAGRGPATAGARHAVANGRSILYRLASASAAAPAQQGRYVVLSETDTETAYAGETKRTTIEDSVTGASTTYQAAFPLDGVAPGPEYTGIPPKLLTPPDASQTAAAYAALPTDPAALREKLLSIARQQNATVPSMTTDDIVYQQADEMLWYPMAPPALRSALYKVLATANGVVVDTGTTDPSGRPAIAMVRTYTGIPETDITYEDPTTGAVLAQVWATRAAGAAGAAVQAPVPPSPAAAPTTAVPAAGAGAQAATTVPSAGTGATPAAATQAAATEAAARRAALLAQKQALLGPGAAAGSASTTTQVPTPAEEAALPDLPPGPYSDIITAVYQPVVSTNTIPADPYTS